MWHATQVKQDAARFYLARCVFTFIIIVMLIDGTELLEKGPRSNLRVP